MTRKEQLENEIAKIEKHIKRLGTKLSILNSMLEEEDRTVPFRLWKCRYTECDHGMGLAGKDMCPGDPREVDCKEYTTEYSDYTGD